MLTTFQQTPDVYESMGEVCCICGHDHEKRSRQRILLNRYVLGTGEYMARHEVHEQGRYLWGDDGEDWLVTAKTCCFPDCLVTFLEGKMIQTDYEGSRLLGDHNIDPPTYS